MCKFNPKNEGTRIDVCLREAIGTLNARGFRTISCCCGHGKYPMTIVYEGKIGGFFELFTGKQIMRKKKFYKRDKEGIYYIPETTSEKPIINKNALR